MDDLNSVPNLSVSATTTAPDVPIVQKPVNSWETKSNKVFKPDIAKVTNDLYRNNFCTTGKKIV